MDTKWKKSKMVIGVVTWFAGMVLFAINMFGLLLEMVHQEHFAEYAGRILHGDYEDTEEFSDFVRYRMSDFLAMSVADDMEDTEKKREAMEKEETYGAGSGPEDFYGEEDWDFSDWEDEDWGLGDLEVTEENAADNEFLDHFYNEPETGYDGGTKYQYYDFYADYGMERYDVVYDGRWNIDKKEAGEIHERLRFDTNVLYRVERNGEVLYTNSENLGQGDRSGIADTVNVDENLVFVMPEGYNYLLYYDGTSLKAWKDGKETALWNAEYEPGCGWYIPGYGNIPQDELYEGSKVCMAVAKTPVSIVKRDFDGSGKTFYSNQLRRIDLQSKDRAAVYRNWIYSLTVSLICIAAGLFLRSYRKQACEKLAKVTGKIWFEIKLLPVLAILFFFGSGILWFFYQIRNEWYGWDYAYELFGAMRDIYLGGTMGNVKLAVLFAAFFFCCGILWLFFVNEMRYWIKPWENSLTGKITGLFRTSMLKLPISKRMVWYGVWVFLLGIMAGLFWVTVFLFRRWGVQMLFVSFVLLAAVLFFQYLYVRNMRRMAADMDCIVGQIEAVHGGNLREDMELSESSGLSEAMEKLKDIRNGMNQAIEERMKSERMKVELIANVSHDIKTPLTSIISYVELLRLEDGLPEHVKEYVAVLGQKSQRLKTMVQDVFEVSKAASGELPVHMEELDLCKLIRQTMADMQEEIASSPVSIKCEMPEDAVTVRADGDRLYRVFQNLIQNALKYSLEGSRIYIRLRVEEHRAVTDLKNTSREELPTDRDFTERFIRGDKSRTDGGSGLGLSIAQSFTEACGGSFRVETIADLFVVTVIFDMVF